MNKKQNLLIPLLLTLTAVLCSCGRNAVTITPDPEPSITQTAYTAAPFVEYSEPDELGCSEEIANYIGNKNSMKFHEPDCRSVGQMKESNKIPLFCTRSEAIDKGYKPCKHCNP